jgi:hypothetical protein
MRTFGATSRRFALAAALALVAAVAGASSTYKVSLQSELNGLDVKFATVERTDGLVVQVTNATAQKVKCTLRFDAQPQPLARKTVYVEAGKTEDVPFAAKRKWFDVEIRVECEPAMS